MCQAHDLLRDVLDPQIDHNFDFFLKKKNYIL